MADVKKLAEELTKLTVLEVNELKTILKEEYGIEPAAAAVAVAGPAADAGAAAADEKTEFTVTLKDAGSQKVAVIKAVKKLKRLLIMRQARSKKKCQKTKLKLPRSLWKTLAQLLNWRRLAST